MNRQEMDEYCFGLEKKQNTVVAAPSSTQIEEAPKHNKQVK